VGASTSESLRKGPLDIGAIQRRRGPQRAEFVGAHRRRPRPGGRRGQTNRGDAIRAGIRQRVQHHGVDHRKQTCTRRNTERKNEDRGYGKPAIAPQRSRRISDILQEDFHGTKPQRIAAIVFHPFNGAEFEERCPPRFAVAHARATKRVRALLYIELQFAVEIALEGRSANQARDAPPYLAHAG
jgi:hypothetical protein